MIRVTNNVELYGIIASHKLEIKLFRFAIPFNDYVAVAIQHAAQRSD